MGSSRVDVAFKSFIAGEALEPFRRVKLGADGETVVYADAGDKGIGTTIDQRITSAEATAGHRVTVKLDNGGGTVLMTVNGDIADKSVLYAAADGEVSATGTVPVAILLDPGDKAADGAALECIPIGGVGGVDEVYETHVVTSGEAAANSGDGRFDFDTGFGAVPGWYRVDLFTVTTGVVKAGFIVLPLSGSDGTLRIDGVDTTAELNEGDILMIHARRTAS